MPKSLVRPTRLKENIEPSLSIYRLENRKPTLNKQEQGTGQEKGPERTSQNPDSTTIPPSCHLLDIDFSINVPMETMALLKIMPIEAKETFPKSLTWVRDQGQQGPDTKQ